MAAGPAIAYRPEIDGLRAVAVLAVMLYHAEPAWLPGGFAGVDVFFVISGYLITRTIAAERALGRFSAREFWERRARRILPALLLMLAPVLLVGIALMTPAELQGLASSAGASILFAGNVYFWRGSGGYFALAAETLPLLHLWSLGVEEQFYLLYPVLLLAAWRWRPGATFGLLLTGLFAGFALSVWTAAHMPVAGFFLLPSRAWELLAGCALALWPDRIGAARGLPMGIRPLVPLAGLAGVLGSFALLRPDTPFPGLAALPVVVGTVALIGGLGWNGSLRRMLSLPPLVGIGLVSYGAYLWHHPMLALARVLDPDALSPYRAALLLVASLAIAGLSWRFVEMPLRRRDRVPLRRFAALMASGAALLLAIAGLAVATGGLPARFPPGIARLASLNPRSAAAMNPCLLPPDAAAPFANACRFGRGDGRPRLVIVGDSHAAALAPGFRGLVDRAGTRGRLLAAAGCPVSLAPTAMSRLQTHCPAMMRRFQAALLADRDARLIVIAARWPFYDRHRFPDNGEGGVERGPDDGLAPDPARTARLGRGLAAFVRPLLAAGRTVLLVYPVPEPGWDVPRHMVHGWQWAGRASAPTIDAAWWQQRRSGAAAMLDAIGTHPGLLRIDPARATCGTGAAARCALTRAGRPLYFDDDHPSTLGARHMIDAALRKQRLDRRLTALLARPD